MPPAGRSCARRPTGGEKRDKLPHWHHLSARLLRGLLNHGTDFALAVTRNTESGSQVDAALALVSHALVASPDDALCHSGSQPNL
jgi:hypothetical protein